MPGGGEMMPQLSRSWHYRRPTEGSNVAGCGPKTAAFRYEELKSQPTMRTHEIVLVAAVSTCAAR